MILPGFETHGPSVNDDSSCSQVSPPWTLSTSDLSLSGPSDKPATVVGASMPRASPAAATSITPLSVAIPDFSSPSALNVNNFMRYARPLHEYRAQHRLVAYQTAPGYLRYSSRNAMRRRHPSATSSSDEASEIRTKPSASTLPKVSPGAVATRFSLSRAIARSRPFIPVSRRSTNA